MRAMAPSNWLMPIPEVESQAMCMNQYNADEQPEASLDRKIDEILASDAFLNHKKQRDDPRVVAFRILGAIFQLNPSQSSEGPFHAQIRRLLPGKTGHEYDELYRASLAEWVEIYGY